MLVFVVPYNPNWPAEFDKEAAKLKALLGNIAVGIHHIGSTAVPGLMAKPIIDIILEVSSLSELDAKNNMMESLGYEAVGENGIPGRRYFRKGGKHRTHQIHAFVVGDANIMRHLAFRDYLIEHKEVAKEYGEIKRKIAEGCNHDIETYCDKKDPFVKLYEGKALAWYERQKDR